MFTLGSYSITMPLLRIFVIEKLLTVTDEEISSLISFTVVLLFPDRFYDEKKTYFLL